MICWKALWAAFIVEPTQLHTVDCGVEGGILTEEIDNFLHFSTFSGVQGDIDSEMDGEKVEICQPLSEEHQGDNVDSADVSIRPVPPPRRHKSGLNEADMSQTPSTAPLIQQSVGSEKLTPTGSPSAPLKHQHHQQRRQMEENFDDFEDDCIPGVVYKPTTLGSQGVTTKTTMGTIRELYTSSPRITDFWRNLKEFIANMGSPAFWISVNVVILVLSLVVMIIGFVYIKDCPVQSNVPIFLIVGAILLVIKCSLTIYQISRSVKRKLRRPDGIAPSKCLTLVIPAVETLIVAFLFAWFVAGCVWVYGNYRHVAYAKAVVVGDNLPTEDANQKFCHEALYTVAFVVLTAFLISFIVTLLTVAVLSVYLCVQSSAKKF